MKNGSGSGTAFNHVEEYTYTLPKNQLGQEVTNESIFDLFGFGDMDYLSVQYFSDSKYEFVELDDWVNGWQLDYWAYIFKDEEYTGYLIEGSFWYGTCKIVYYGLCD